jgi:acetoin utilization deacetylase AcuC-like enzyme
VKNKKIKVFYTDKQVCVQDIASKSYSKSPLKPKLLMEYLHNNGFEDNLDIVDDFKPFTPNIFKIAHTEQYVADFFSGTGYCGANGLPWSKELAESVKYTNSSLYHAIKYACQNPDTMTFSPTSGFHHAMPHGGAGFCTFSGQVIASVKLYRELGMRGAYFDLDGHYGNSIGDSKEFVSDLDDAIIMNVNPKGTSIDYLKDLADNLRDLAALIRAGYIDYVVWAHGADSHKWDQLGHQLSTEEWIEASQMFYSTIKNLEQDLGKSIPVILTLFGGYRDDDYESVLSLHTSDIREGLSILCDVDIQYTTRVLKRKYLIRRVV